MAVGAPAKEGFWPRTPLERVLDLEQIASSNVFVGQPREEAASSATRTHLFGGLIAAQSVAAACRTVAPNYRIHSLHSYFILAGDGRMPIMFQVTEIRNGGSFQTRQVLATQENKNIFMMTASFREQLSLCRLHALAARSIIACLPAQLIAAAVTACCRAACCRRLCLPLQPRSTT